MLPIIRTSVSAWKIDAHYSWNNSFPAVPEGSTVYHLSSTRCYKVNTEPHWRLRRTSSLSITIIATINLLIPSHGCGAPRFRSIVWATHRWKRCCSNWLILRPVSMERGRSIVLERGTHLRAFCIDWHAGCTSTRYVAENPHHNRSVQCLLGTNVWGERDQDQGTYHRQDYGRTGERSLLSQNLHSNLTELLGIIDWP